jgi:hypothetical protein
MTSQGIAKDSLRQPSRLRVGIHAKNTVRDSRMPLNQQPFTATHIQDWPRCRAAISISQAW